MKMKKRKILLISLMFLLSLYPLLSQTLKTADLNYEGGAYYSASNMYRSLLSSRSKSKEITDKRGQILFRIGECYRKMSMFEDAKKWYLQAQGSGYLESDLYYGMGLIELQYGNYAEAKKIFQMSRDRNPGDLRIESKILSCDIQEIYKIPNTQHEIKPLENLNTRGSEYGLSFYGDRLIFASTGTGSSKKSISERTGLPYSSLYISSPDSRSLYGKVEKMESISENKSNEGTFSYDLQTDQLYCTRCESNERNCYIIKIKEKNGKYKEEGKLKLGNQTYGIGHPYLTEDGRRIYFTSTIEGGYGGADLWYVDRDVSGAYGTPVNLGGSINTSGDEVFPSFMDGILYFASDGHPGLGGLDLYASYLETDGSFSAPFNLRYPFNSSWDDFNLVHRPNSNIGMFVSNRNNSESSDDIYVFDNFPPHLIIICGQLYDEESKLALQDYTIVVNEGNRKIYESHIDSGAYYLYLGPGKKYDIHINKSGYLPNTQLLNTTGVKNYSELKVDSYLTNRSRHIDISGDSRLSDSSVFMMIEMKDIFYEFDKFRLTSASKLALDKYVDYFRQYPYMRVEISSHTDSRGRSEYNDRLSDYRAKTVVDYFVSKGISSDRLLWHGYGERQPVIRHALTETEHQANRRTVFRILTLGLNNSINSGTKTDSQTGSIQPTRENVVVRHISALEMMNRSGGVIDMSGWWVQVHESDNYRELELPLIKQSEQLTGKEVMLIRCDDGKYRYCIQYTNQSDAISAQVSLMKANIHAILLQF
jgi:outer membrane protein OmpA-like peptidoglycan-associated protein/tetratricopeptide (TPR) repeat protein